MEYSRIPKKHELESKEKNMKIEIDEMKKEIQQIKVDIVNQKVCNCILFIEQQIKALKMFGPKIWCSKKTLSVTKSHTTDIINVLSRTNFFTNY